MLIAIQLYGKAIPSNFMVSYFIERIRWGMNITPIEKHCIQILDNRDVDARGIVIRGLGV
ncbi:hypothetical protein P872_02910 [Rhodonellum psychrophilum GCM71 = DSM 17998]|uniref:Uncharacterized protein n=2 Tax=Rhodonellum TaxID=336827 RepID=U5C1A2_9BACT|nr:MULTISPECIES: hypothetical protein [Rhodonellum]ERM83589.1 hypothetical protein P872_02910 [Rhodonellum psychrophilum GCM71 = DSM 17998]SDY48983.1 hypothetical protein SAMN05444412_101311 [Rhodonellum ikkaensis]